MYITLLDESGGNLAFVHSKIRFSGFHLCVYLLLNQGDGVGKHPVREDNVTLVILIKLIEETNKRISILWREEGIAKPLKLSLSIDDANEKVNDRKFKALEVSEDRQQRSRPLYLWLSLTHYKVL